MILKWAAAQSRNPTGNLFLRCAALGAELGAGRQIRSAAGARSLERRSALHAELRGLRERVPARGGRVASKLLPHLEHPERDVFDAGRNTPEGTRERFLLRGVLPGRPLRLVFRAAPVADLTVPVSIDGRAAGTLVLPRTDGWLEAGVDLPPPSGSQLAVELGPSGERNLYHVWAVQPR